MLYLESRLPLSKQEEEVRDAMVYLFNPALKFILLSQGYDKFKLYGFNSCRQTAILGAGYLRKLLPDYTIHVYEGLFKEDIEYYHAFITAEKNGRELIIDLSRTTKKLLFDEIYPNIYPLHDDYKDVRLISKIEYNLDDMLNTDEPEFLTGYKPKEFMKMLECFIEEIKLLSKDQQLAFCDKIYSQTTLLRR